MSRLTVTGLADCFRSPSLPLTTKAQLHTDGLPMIALSNISEIIALYIHPGVAFMHQYKIHAPTLDRDESFSTASEATLHLKIRGCN